MTCNGDAYDYQGTPYAMAFSFGAGGKTADTTLTNDNGMAHIYSVHPDAGQGMLMVESPDCYVWWRVDEFWRDKKTSMYYRTGPTSKQYIPIMGYGAHVSYQIVAKAGFHVNSFNGLAGSDPIDEKVKGQFFPNMTTPPDIEVCLNGGAVAPYDMARLSSAALSVAMYPIGCCNYLTLEPTQNTANTYTSWSVMNEWDTVSNSGNVRGYQNTVHVPNWAVIKWEATNTVGFNAVWSSKPKATSL